MHKQYYLVEADIFTTPLETSPISSFKVAHTVYKSWSEASDTYNVRMYKCTGEARIHIEI